VHSSCIVSETPAAPCLCLQFPASRQRVKSSWSACRVAGVYLLLRLHVVSYMLVYSSPWVTRGRLWVTASETAGRNVQQRLKSVSHSAEISVSSTVKLCDAKGKGKASSLDIAPLTILNSGALQPRKWQLTGNDCNTAAQTLAAQSPRYRTIGPTVAASRHTTPQSTFQIFRQNSLRTFSYPANKQTQTPENTQSSANVETQLQSPVC